MSEKEQDPNAPNRKKDHIELAFRSQVERRNLDDRFYYEPMLSSHPVDGPYGEFPFLGKSLRAPVWVSSMTGGTEWARTINQNLARACKDFGMGMGLGSCRALLYSDEYLEDFNVRAFIGDDLPLYANLGIAQVEELLAKRETSRITALLEKLSADGLIIHVNPMQEWLQPEGDLIRRKPVETVAEVLEQSDYPVIVKEVGQGMGRESLRALLQMPLAAIEFAASGGTNFAMLELLRAEEELMEAFQSVSRVGHTAEEMVEMVNALVDELGEKRRCQELIISGGVRTFLDGYYLIQRSTLSSVYGQASAFLKHARGSYDVLERYVSKQVEGLKFAKAFLQVKKA
jgi:isopentenyl-diphosphate delta-isomerase